MRALAATPDGLGLSELARAVDLPKSTVHRLVSALEAEDFVTTSNLGQIRLGPAVASLGAATRRSFPEQVDRLLLTLHTELNETVDLSVLDGASVRFVDHISAPHRLQAVSAVGTAFPLHCTANGKAFLATMARAQADALLPPRLPGLTPHTITTRRDLWAALDEVRHTRVAFDREEHTLGICAVGAIIHDPYGPIAAISVPVPSERFAGNEDRLAASLLRVCDECSAVLGAE